MTTVIYHNPRCSKSRQTLELLLELLNARGESPQVIEYLKNPPDHATLARILDLLGLEPRQLMRRDEPEYKENNLDNQSIGRDDLIDAMVRMPRLMQRPIVLANGKAALGRPPEQILDIL
jgi:arsenate reductase